MILLDTHAVLWLDAGRKQAKPLDRHLGDLCVSPVSILEIQMLVEPGEVRLAQRSSAASFLDDERWVVDEPPAEAWFVEAALHAWTRDPFDRLLVAHAKVRGCRLATADELLLAHLGPRHALEL